MGVITDLPDAGEKMDVAASIIRRLSICASIESGTCTAIWSPSKSALNGVHTIGWRRMALPSTSTGSNAWMERRWSVGARLRNTVLSLMTSSRMSHTWSSCFSIILRAVRTVWQMSLSRRARMMNGSKRRRAISFGRPHCGRRSSGPTTITERPE